MLRAIYLVLIFLLTSNFVLAGEPIKLALSTPDETASVFLELFTEKFSKAKESHPDIVELNNETIQNFVVIKSSKSSIQKEDSSFSILLKEILGSFSLDKINVDSIQGAAFNWAKEKYDQCTMDGIVYIHDEENGLDKEKCSFREELKEALAKARAKNALERVKNPNGINIKELVEDWKRIEGELGGLDYHFIFPIVLSLEPTLDAIREMFNLAAFNFVSSDKKSIKSFFNEIASYYDGSPFESIVRALNRPSIKGAYYFSQTFAVEKSFTLTTYSLLILDEHNQMFGLEVRVSRVN